MSSGGMFLRTSVRYALSKQPALPQYVKKPPVEYQTLKDGEAMKVLRPPRAVTVEETPIILPARESNTTSMMPWKGWFLRFLEESVFTPEQYKKFRYFWFFDPEDLYDLQQAPKMTQKVQISKDDPTITHMYRWPSPGSQAPPHIPTLEDDEDPYDSGYYKRDTRRRFKNVEDQNIARERILLLGGNPDDPEMQAELSRIEAGPLSSPGNQGRFATGPTDFDPSGLRSTMSATWSEYEKSLDKNMPDHLPTPVWYGKEAEISAWYKERDLPVPVGGVYEDLFVERERRVAIW
jgi:hypothetical protein